jgi:hypothetical protein
MSFEGRAPDFVLKVKSKTSTARTRRCGVAWANVEGEGIASISIQLDPCTVISWNDEVFITLFPFEEGK